MLQSPHIKNYVKAIGVGRSLSNSAIFEHRCLQNINKLHKRAGKYDEQQQFKYIIEDAMVSTTE